MVSLVLTLHLLVAFFLAETFNSGSYQPTQNIPAPPIVHIGQLNGRKHNCLSVTTTFPCPELFNVSSLFI